MKRLLLALLATHNLAYAGVVIVDETAAKKKQGAPVATSAAQSAQSLAAGSGADAAEKLAVAKPTAKTWTVTSSDHSVRALFERWTKESGYQLFWDHPKELELNGRGEITGSFDDALSWVLETTLSSETPAEAVIYDGNKAVRVLKHIPQGK